MSTVLLALPVLEVVKSEMMPPMPTALSLQVLEVVVVMSVVVVVVAVGRSEQYRLQCKHDAT